MPIRVFAALGRALALLLVTLGLACSGGSRPQGEPAGTIVSFYTRSVDTDFNQASLVWLVQPGADALTLEARLDTTDWTPLDTEPIPPDTAGVNLFFLDTAPELTTITFRLSSIVKGKVFMQRTATYRRTLKPPLNLGIAVDAEWGEVALAWSRAADTVATGFLLETSADGKTWTAAPGQPVVDAGGRYQQVHTGAGEGMERLYRVVPLGGSERGMPATGTAHLPPTPPDGLTVTPEGGGLRLAWTNRSQGADQVQVSRATWNRNGLWTPEVVVTTLSRTDATYLDAAHPVADRIAYRVSALKAGGPQAPSLWAVAGAPATLAGGTVRRTPLAFPFIPLVRDAQGGWVGYRSRYSGDPYQTRILRQPQAAGFPLTLTHRYGGMDSATATFTAVSRGPGRLDLAMSEAADALGTCDLRVLRLADGTWSAPVAQPFDGRTLALPTFLGDVSLAGFLLDRSWQRQIFTLSPAGVLAAGASPDSGEGFVWMGDTAAGALKALVMRPEGWCLATRAADGIWSWQALAGLPAGDVYTVKCLGAVLDGQGRFQAAFACPGPGGAGQEIHWVRILPDGAQTHERVPGTLQLSWIPAYGFAVTADGTQAAAAALDDAGTLVVMRRGADGTWSTSTLALPDGATDYVSPDLRCGFLADGTFWIRHMEVRTPEAPGHWRYYELLEWAPR